MKIMRANYAPPPPNYSSNLRNIISKCLSLEPHRRPNTSQLLCDPILFKTMLVLYADIGAYQPISNSKKAKSNTSLPPINKGKILFDLFKPGFCVKLFGW
jgi:serine/threonine protein kinase